MHARSADLAPLHPQQIGPQERRLLRILGSREDAVDKHPVTPGALLPVREILADLLLENGAATQALKEYQAVLKDAPRRFQATAGAARAADKAGDRAQARAYALQLLDVAKDAEGARPELAWARTLVGRAILPASAFQPDRRAQLAPGTVGVPHQVE